jgi:hypothetical protein
MKNKWTVKYVCCDYFKDWTKFLGYLCKYKIAEFELQQIDSQWLLDHWILVETLKIIFLNFMRTFLLTIVNKYIMLWYNCNRARRIESISNNPQ